MDYLMIQSSLPRPDAFDEPFFFFSNDENSEILYVSPSIEKILGYQPSDLIGRRYTEFFDQTLPLNETIGECRTRRFESGDADIHHQLRVVQSRDGETKILKIQTYGNKNPNGQVVTNHGIAEDITESYLAKERLHQRWAELRKSDRLLSARERQVLKYVVEGRLNKSIARELSITERAVERIRARLKEKFKTESSAELVAKATELRLMHEMGQIDAPNNEFAPQ